MARYIDADAVDFSPLKNDFDRARAKVIIMGQPTADVVEVKTIKSWLYEMALNNVGCHIEGDFSNACEEIISRLDGLRAYASERRSNDD